MPYVYSTVVPGTGAGVDSSAAIPLAPVGRWMRPHGSDLGQSGAGLNLSRHILPRHLQYIPFKPQYNMTVDQIGIQYYDLNSCVDTWYYKLGLYASADNYPSTLIADYGVVSVDPAIPTTPGPLTLPVSSQVLTGGTLYFLAIGINQSGGTDQAAGRTPKMGMLNGDFVNMRRRGQASVASGMDGVAWLEQLNSFGGTFPTSTSYANVVAGTNWAIRPTIRRSA